jgi:hypothetical protein
MAANDDDFGVSASDRLGSYRARAKELRRMAELMRNDSARFIRSAADGYDQVADKLQEVLQRSGRHSPPTQVATGAFFE